MKRLTVITGGLVVAGLLTTASAEPQTAKPAPKPPAPADVKVKMPPAIAAAFMKAYPTATVLNVAREVLDGREIYEVESTDKGMSRNLDYLADGTVLQYEEQIPAASVPPAVLAAIKAKYPKATLGLCEKLFKNGTMNYEIQLTGAPVPEVVVSPDGKLVE